MMRVGNWLFGAFVPAFMACIGVLLTIDADEAFKAQNTARAICFTVLSLGAFCGLFSYLEWNRPKNPEKG